MGTEDKVPKTTSAMNEVEKKLKCGIIMPISAIAECNKQHWDEVKRILEEAIKDADFIPNLVSDANDSGIIQSRIVQNVYDNEMIICDVSCKNPNVMFELGLRLAFDKPTIIIMDDKTTYSFDTAPIEHIGYPRDLNYHTINDFKNKLSQKIKATYQSSITDNANTFLKHFGEFKIATIEHKEGSVNDVILSKLESLNQQVFTITRSINAKTEEQYSQEQITQIVDEGIRQYCKLIQKDYNDFIFSDEQSPERKALYEYLEDKASIRKVCKTSQILKKTIQDILELF